MNINNININKPLIITKQMDTNTENTCLTFDHIIYNRDQTGDYLGRFKIHFVSNAEANFFISQLVESDDPLNTSDRTGEYIYIRNFYVLGKEKFIQCKLSENKRHLSNNLHFFSRKCPNNTCNTSNTYKNFQQYNIFLNGLK